MDPASGAVSLYFPLGPGIGRTGLRYVPALVGRFAPQVEWSAVPDLTGRTDHRPVLIGTTGFELSPGSLDLPLILASGGESPQPFIRWTYPDGSGGGAGAPLAAEADPMAILARFGCDPSSGPGHLPHRAAPAYAPLAFHGTGGDFLVALAEETRIPAEEMPCLGMPGEPAWWIVPTRLLAVRGDLAYEFRFAGRSPGCAHYRLTAIRSSSGELMTFTYGANGADFDVEWAGSRVRVALDGMTAAQPVPALDADPSDLGPGTPSQAFGDAEARLRITYEGPDAIPGYTVHALGRSQSGQASWRRALQVTRVQGDAAGETLQFSYGKADAETQAGPAGTQCFAPTVLREITSPGRILRLDWEGQPHQRQTAEGGGLAQDDGWRFGVTALHDHGVGGMNGATYVRAAQVTEPLRASARPAGNPWVRQSRHFALGPGAEAGAKCHTYVRDRWAFGRTCAGGEAAGAEGPQRRIPYDYERDIPTFEFDPRTSTLVPVAGRLTRWLNWGPGSEESGPVPDLHRARPHGGTGLKGGMGLQPTAQPGSITYDPGRRVATMEIFSGPATGGVVNYGPLGPGGEAAKTLAAQVARSQQIERDIAQRSAGIAAQMQQQAASAAAQVLQEQQARQQAAFKAMDEQMKAQLAELQRRPMELAASLPKMNLEPTHPPPQGRSGADHPSNQEGIRNLQSVATSMAGKPGDVMVMIWDWKQGGVFGPAHSVGHAALAVRDDKRGWRIVQSQFPHEPGGKSKIEGPNVLISNPRDLLKEEGGKPDTAFLVMVPDLGGLAIAAMADLRKEIWHFDPGHHWESFATNCTYGIIRSLRAGGVPLKGMWANQTLILPGSPYTPRDLRTALDRETPFNAIHPFKIHHRNDLIGQINWEQ